MTKAKWRNRRRIIYSSLYFCMFVWIYVLLAPIFDIELIKEIANTALTMTAIFAGSIIGSYVFGATWETINIKKK